MARKMRKAAQAALAETTMNPDVQIGFNVIKGSAPARMDISDAKFDMCGKKAIADIKAANAKGTFLGSMAQNYAQPPAIANAAFCSGPRICSLTSSGVVSFSRSSRWPCTETLASR